MNRNNSRFNSRLKIKNKLPMGIYRHYTGGYINTIGLARHETTGEPLVIFQTMQDDFSIWAQTPADFSKRVVNQGHMIRRYTYVKNFPDKEVPFEMDYTLDYDPEARTEDQSEDQSEAQPKPQDQVQHVKSSTPKTQVAGVSIGKGKRKPRKYVQGGKIYRR